MDASMSENVKVKKSTGRISVQAPGHGKSLARIRSLVADIAHRVGFPEDEVAKIEMAVDEACSNVVKHAYAADKPWYSHRDPELRMEVFTEANRLVIEIQDHGARFNLIEYRPPPIEEGIQRLNRGGFGLAIIRKFMDEIQFTSTAETGNTLRLVKYLQKS
jgi:serine/threonine-protein kinase RsbW